jgi:hypothetical protein
MVLKKGTNKNIAKLWILMFEKKKILVIILGKGQKFMDF